MIITGELIGLGLGLTGSSAQDLPAGFFLHVLVLLVLADVSFRDRTTGDPTRLMLDKFLRVWF